MSSCFQILSSDIRKFHYEHQIHRTNMNEHWLNCLYTRVKPALNKNLTCHLLFDIFQTFSNNWFFRKISQNFVTFRYLRFYWTIIKIGSFWPDHRSKWSCVRNFMNSNTYDLPWSRSWSQVWTIGKSHTIVTTQFRSENGLNDHEG